jgi:ABC-2 type transport system ATP-binding protein
MSEAIEVHRVGGRFGEGVVLDALDVTVPAGTAIDETQMAGPSSSPAISAVGVRKSFGDLVVLDGVELTVEQGSVFALLGPNGAGKTTMVRILATLLEPDRGEIRVAGRDLAHEPDAVRDAIGVTGQFSAVDELLTGRENLALMADLHHLARADARARIGELLERFELVEAADRMAVTYSGGMRRRLDLAMTLIGAPQIIFLDEPTTGLDPRSRRTVWDIVRSLASGGITVFLTTQYLEEADQLADRVAILDRGRLVAEGTAQELKRLIPGGRIDLSFADAATQLAAAEAMRLPARNEDAITLQIPTDGNVATLRRVLRELDEAGIDVVDLAIHTPDLDDVFLAITGRHDRSQKPRGEKEPQT